MLIINSSIYSRQQVFITSMYSILSNVFQHFSSIICIYICSVLLIYIHYKTFLHWYTISSMVNVYFYYVLFLLVFVFMLFYSSYITLVLHGGQTVNIKTKCTNEFEPWMMFFPQRGIYLLLSNGLGYQQVKITKPVCFHI